MSAVAPVLALAPAFADPVTASQATFRAVMDALARPGSIHRLPAELAPPAPLGRGMAAVALALLDYESAAWLDAPLAAAPEVAQWLRFHTGAPVTADPAAAAFALVSDANALPAFDRFALGSPEYPDRSTTLVIEVSAFEVGSSEVAVIDGEQPLRISGPGIAGVRTFQASPLPKDFTARLRANRALFPRGVDLVFVCGDLVAALPRSTRVAEEG